MTNSPTSFFPKVSVVIIIRMIGRVKAKDIKKQLK
jgi:hypothetical protein